MRTSIISLSLVLGLAGVASADIIYDSIPDPYPSSLPSIGYQATQTAELGDLITFAGTNRQLTTVRVGMVNWARKSTYFDTGTSNWMPGFTHVNMDATGFDHSLTLNLYNVNNSGPTPVVGSVIASKSVTAHILWRPDGWPTNGYLQGVDFDFSSLDVTLPDSLIWGIAYNTNTWGASPIGLPGPYESLNVGLSPATTVGSTDADTLFWNTQTAAWYTDGGTAGVGIFRQDTDWSSYPGGPAIEVNVIPEPGTLSLLGLGSLLALRRRRA